MSTPAPSFLLNPNPFERSERCYAGRHIQKANEADYQRRLSYYLPTPETLSIIKEHCQRTNQELLSRNVFKKVRCKSVERVVRPPSKRYLGMNLRKTEMVATTMAVMNEALSVERGLPQHSAEAGLERQEKSFFKDMQGTL